MVNGALRSPSASKKSGAVVLLHHQHIQTVVLGAGCHSSARRGLCIHRRPTTKGKPLPPRFKISLLRCHWDWYEWTFPVPPVDASAGPTGHPAGVFNHERDNGATEAGTHIKEAAFLTCSGERRQRAVHSSNLRATPHCGATTRSTGMGSAWSVWRGSTFTASSSALRWQHLLKCRHDGVVRAFAERDVGMAVHRLTGKRPSFPG